VFYAPHDLRICRRCWPISSGTLPSSPSLPPLSSSLPLLTARCRAGVDFTACLDVPAYGSVGRRSRRGYVRRSLAATFCGSSTCLAYMLMSPSTNYRDDACGDEAKRADSDLVACRPFSLTRSAFRRDKAARRAASRRSTMRRIISAFLANSVKTDIFHRGAWPHAVARASSDANIRVHSRSGRSDPRLLFDC